MEKLPQDIILDILLRLPYQSIVNCNLVCKPWRDLLSSTNLDYLFLVGMKRGMRKDLQLYHGEQKYDDIDIHGSYSCKTLGNFDNHPTPPAGSWFKLVGSSNGLVCFAVEHDLVYDPTYICNPTTGEFVNLPKYVLVDEDYELPHRFGGDFFSGFGYSYSTDEYKVVRMYSRCGYPYPKDRSLKVQVYTLGNSLGWRDKGRAEICILKSEADGSENGVCANGALHWIGEERKIVAFDLADEKFLSIALPSVYFGYFTLKLLGGYLSVFHVITEQKGTFVNIWSLKKKKHCNCYDMGEDGFSNFWSWIKEFSIPWDGAMYYPFGVTKSKQVLLWFRDVLCCYDSRTTTLTKLWDIDSSRLWVQAFPHLHSLVSLEALGEKSRKKNITGRSSSQLCELQ